MVLSPLYSYLGLEIQSSLANMHHIVLLFQISPVLNIGRVGQDIIRYLLFCLLPIRYEEIVHHIVCSKKRPINEISADKSSKISPDMK